MRDAPPLGVLILAAGRSGRMGRPKLLLPWGDTSVLGHHLATWRRLGAAQIAVVHAQADQPVWLELVRLGFPAGNCIANPNPERGMFSSIQCAASWRGWHPQLESVAIVLGDQPHVGEASLRTLLAYHALHPAGSCQPRHDGRLCHPVVLPIARFRALAHEVPTTTLKECLKSTGQSTFACDLDDDGLALDIDTPADYQRALRFVHT